MYQIVENQNLVALENKLARRYQKKSSIDCLGRYHQINYWNLMDDGQIEILYRHSMNENTYPMTLKTALLSFQLEIQKNNRYYSQYHSDEWDQPKPLSNVISRKNIQLLGVTISDLFKHFYYNQTQSENQILDEICSPEFSEQDDQFVSFGERPLPRHLISRLFKKAVGTDTSSSTSANVLGLYNGHSFYLWEGLNQCRHNGKHSTNFQQFCQQIVYFSQSTIDSCIRLDQNRQPIVDHSSMMELLNSLSNLRAIKKLLKYFIYNEDPELTGVDEICYFDPPKSIPEILKYFHEKTDDHNYLDLHNRILKKLNQNQTTQLQTKYQPIIFGSVAKIPAEYPIYSYRNICVTQWKTHGYSNDIHKLLCNYRQQQSVIRQSKYKYRRDKSAKQIPIDDYYYRYSDWESPKGYLKQYNRFLASELEDAHQILAEGLI